MTFSPYYVTLLALFAIVAYMIAADKNVATLIVLICKTVQVQVSRYIFMAKMYPKLRYDTFMMRRRMGGISKKHLSMAQELLESIRIDEEKEEKGDDL